MKYFLLFIIFLCPVFAFGQAAGVSVGAEKATLADSLGQPSREVVQVGDSSQLVVQHQLDSLQGQLVLIQQQLDSLEEGGRGDDKFQDSLQQVLHKGQALQQQLEKKKNALVAPVAKVPGLEGQVAGLNSAQAGLPELTVPGFNLPQTSLPDVAGLAPTLPDAALPEVGGDNVLQQLPQANLPGIDLPQQLQHVPKIDSSTFSGATIDKQLEQQLLKQKEVGEFKEHAGLDGNPLQEWGQLDAKDLAKEQTQQAQEQLMAQLPDHKVALEKARRDLSKYNGRFSEIKSVKDLPKNPLKRHPLMGVRWYKRLQPGLQWQVGLGDAVRIDIGPRLSYLLTDQVELGISYQERLSIDKTLPTFASFRYDRVWGYDLFGSFEFKKGFYGQLSYERLNTLMQQLPHQQEESLERLWVEGVRLGLGKRYTLYKQLRGYSLMEYNFTKSLHAPYRQQLQLKVGLFWDRRSSR